MWLTCRRVKKMIDHGSHLANAGLARYPVLAPLSRSHAQIGTGVTKTRVRQPSWRTWGQGQPKERDLSAARIPYHVLLALTLSAAASRLDQHPLRPHTVSL